MSGDRAGPGTYSPTRHGQLLRSETGTVQLEKRVVDIGDEFNAWNNIRMIICDTTAVNSGPKSSCVVVRLQEEFKKRNLSINRIAASYFEPNLTVLQ